jgi:hypothetical protein
MVYKIACCISGLPNKHTIEHLNRLIKYRDNIDFFIFFWDVIGNDEKQNIMSMLHPKMVLYQKPIIFPYDAKYKEPDKSANKSNELSMFYGISQVQTLRQKYEQQNKMMYDIVIRFRYDIYLFDDFLISLNKINSLLTTNNIVFPWEHHHIGICDQVWFGRSLVMDKFCALFIVSSFIMCICAIL